MKRSKSIRYLLAKQYDAFDLEADLDLDRIIELTLDDEFELIDLAVTSLNQPEKVPVGQLVSLRVAHATADRFDSPDERHSVANAIRSYCESAKAYVDFLSKLDEQKLYDLVTNQIKIDNREQQLLDECADAADFFNKPEASAVMADWLSMPNWTIDEATALVIGRDPGVVNIESMSKIKRKSPFKEKYEKIRDIISRAVVSELLERNIKPATFVRWAGTALHPRIVDLSLMIDMFVDGEFAENAKLPPQTKKMINNLLRIIAALVCAKEDIDLSISTPPSVRSKLLEGVMADLSKIGIKGLRPQTVAKRLDQAIATARADANRAREV